MVWDNAGIALKEFCDAILGQGNLSQRIYSMKNDRVAAVTGASRGIGRALAIALAKEDWAVGLCSRNQEQIQSTAQEVARASPAGAQHVLFQVCDLSKFYEAQYWIKAIVARFGRIDMLINNAGILGSRLMIEEYPHGLWEEVIRVNSMSLFCPTKACLVETMLRQGSGLIVNISSGVGHVGKARWGPYAAAKFGLEGFSQVLAAELYDRGIIVVSVNPEATRTSMRAAAYPQEDPMALKTPEEFVAKLVPWLRRLKKADSGKFFNFKEIEG
ncbi:MAG: SDR family NAD(P)-dependent oxidoreductase [Elusimicrobia bacterium]|nr:SDR family NAD(P)-dependent oxidoreductase [Elusimicrobiota bacterium]